MGSEISVNAMAGQMNGILRTYADTDGPYQPSNSSIALRNRSAAVLFESARQVCFSLMCVSNAVFSSRCPMSGSTEP